MTYCIGICIAFYFVIVASMIDTSIGQQCRVLADCDGGQVRWENLVPGQQGMPGPIGQKGEPGPAVNITELKASLREHKKAPKLYKDVSTLTWQSSKEFCSRLGRTLCSHDQICLGKLIHGGRKLIRDVVPGEHWVAIKDAYNEWTQIGHYPVVPCRLHTPIWGPPTWGASNVSLPHKGFVYCCESEAMEYVDNAESDIRYQYIGNIATYASSLAHCEQQGRRLCNSTEVCVSSEPVFGMLIGPGYKWVAVGDKFNEWIHIGNYQGQTCKTNGQIPAFGVRTDGSQRGDVGYAYCCKDGAAN